jgi:hypothetical protein
MGFFSIISWKILALFSKIVYIFGTEEREMSAVMIQKGVNGAQVIVKGFGFVTRSAILTEAEAIRMAAEIELSRAMKKANQKS